MKNRMARFGSLVLITLLGVGVMVAGAPAASATHEGQATAVELLNACNAGRTDKCEFRPSGITTYAGPRMLAGSGQNCGSGTDTRVIRWEATAYTSNTWGVEVSATSKVGKTFEYSVKTSYSREWGWSETQTDEYRAELKPWVKKELYASKLRSRVNGTWEINFGSRFKGHYIWYINGGNVVGQTKGSPWEITSKEVKNTC